jgi:subtilisin family serine protease
MTICSRFSWRSAVFSMLSALALSAHAAATTAVRVDARDAALLATLALDAKTQIDYGSFQWLKLDDAALAKLSGAGVRFVRVEDANQIQIGTRRFDPLNDASRSVGPATAEPGDRGLNLIQFEGPIKSAWLDQLRADGLTVLQYYPQQTMLVWGAAADVARSRSAHLPVRWSGPVQAGDKLSPSLIAKIGVIENVDVFVYNDGRLEATKDSLRALGAKVINVFAAQPDLAFYHVIASLDAAALDAAAAIPTVLNLSYSSPRAYFDDELSNQINANNLNTDGTVTGPGYLAWLQGIGLNGSGVTWAVTDSGVDRSHPDLINGISGGYSYPGCPASALPGDDNASGGHGTHVAGTIAGRGVGDGSGPASETDAAGYLHGQGVAPAASIFALNPICVNSVPWPPAGGWQENSKQALIGGATGTNNSWTSGEGAGRGYLASARTHDIMVRDGNFDTAALEPFVLLFSAGNSGPNASTITAPKEAKNAIIVAASNNQRAGSTGALASFSSRGPAIDGRIMPTVAAPGATIHSTRRLAGGAQCATAIAGTSNAAGQALYSACSGTSMASPHVAGSAVLLTQWWRNNNSDATPSPAMLKALLINGSTDMSGTAPIPNNDEGFGRVNVPGSLARGLNGVYRDQTTVLSSPGQVFELNVGVPSSTEPLRVALVWTDAPGAADANPALVNNLDLEVVSGGETFRGNVFSDGASVTGGSADNRNNIEIVRRPVTSGNATIRVIATALNGDALAGNGSVGTPRQDFALVCSNCASQPDYTLDITPTTRSVCAPASVSYAVNVGSVLGYVEPVTLSVSDAPTGTTAVIGGGASAVTPPGARSVDVSASASASAGTYLLTLNAASLSGNRARPLELKLWTATPAAATLTAPSDGATLLNATPTLSWTGAPQSDRYAVEVSTSPSFATLAFSATNLSASSVTVAPSLASDTLYYWRVRASNLCGSGTLSAVRSFRTPPLPGACANGRVTTTLLNNTVENGDAGWTHAPATGGGVDTWAIGSEFATSPTMAWRNTGHSAASDQLLTSPSLTLPTASDAPLTLKFQQRRHFEARTGGCYDGGMVEVAVNGGPFTQVPAAQLLNDPYTGPGAGNPAAPAPIWCAEPARPFAETLIDMTPYAGNPVQFRFRVVTDGSVNRAGWAIDDIAVQSCRSDLIFGNGFQGAP